MKKRILTPEEVGALLDWENPSDAKAMEPSEREDIRTFRIKEKSAVPDAGTHRSGENEQLFRSVLDVLGEAMVITDAQGKILFGNTLSRLLLKKSPSSIRKKHFSHAIKILDGSGIRQDPDPFEKALKEKEKIPFPPGTHLSLANGEVLPVSGSATPILHQEGEIEGVVVSFHRTVLRSSLPDPLPSPPRRRVR